MNHNKNYANLKNQKGGQKVLSLLSEINGITESLIIHTTIRDMIRNGLSSRLSIIEVPNISGATLYNQDPYIILKNVNNDNYAIQVSHQYGINLLTQQTINISTMNNGNDNDKGGNFIASPNNKFIFCIDGMSSQLNQIFNTYVNQQIIKIQCSFRAGGGRHIDELMCFRPYGNGMFKVWIYYVRNIHLSDNLREVVGLVQNFDNVKQKLLEWQITLAKERDIATSDFVKETKQRLIDNLTEIITPTSGDNFMKAFSGIKGRINLPLKLAINMYYNLDNSGTKINNLNIIQQEMINNYNIVANALWNTNYDSVKDNFVPFPIDIIVDENVDCKIVNPPIFNGLWIETDDMVVNMTSLQYDETINQILSKELMLLRSNLNINKPIHHLMYDTLKYHNDGKIGGNLHCLVKQIIGV